MVSRISSSFLSSIIRPRAAKRVVSAPIFVFMHNTLVAYMYGIQFRHLRQLLHIFRSRDCSGGPRHSKLYLKHQGQSEGLIPPPLSFIDGIYLIVKLTPTANRAYMYAIL